MDYSSLEEVALTQQLVQIESSNPGTYEGNVSDFVYEWLSKNTCAEVVREKVHDERYNVIAKLHGKV